MLVDGGVVVRQCRPWTTARQIASRLNIYIMVTSTLVLAAMSTVRAPIDTSNSRQVYIEARQSGSSRPEVSLTA